jgi:DhnA family fructose-bisphosphate aldolase class Ia
VRSLFESTKEERLRKIVKEDGRTLLVAFDHAVEHGPVVYEGINLDPRRIARIAEEGGADGIIVHIGAAKYIKPVIKRIPIIVKLTARTNLSPKETEVQQLVTTVEEAKEFGATAVAATLYVGADRESEMLRLIAEIKKECLRLQMPLFGFAYPRSKKQRTKYDPDAIRYAARVGAEIGFDVVKTYYPGNKDDWKKVVRDAGFVPVVAAGGPALSDAEDVIKVVKDIMDAGAAGVAFGRNIWTRDDETAINLLKELRKIIHPGV